MILSISHLDLDGVSAQIVLRQYKQEITNMNIGYGQVDEYLEIVDDYCYRMNPKEVFITDLSFKYTQLETLNKIATKHPNINFVFIDHHPFEENNGEYKHLILNNLKIIISDKASATKLTFLYLSKSLGIKFTQELEKYVSYVNAYDIWLDDTPEFKVGFLYNELFWKYQLKHFWSRFKDEYKIRNSDKEEYKEIIKKKNKLFKKLEDSGRIMTFNKRIFLIFLDDFQGHVTIDYPGFLSYIIIRSNGGVSVRLDDKISNNGNTKNNIVKKVLELDYITEAGGHNSAFGTRIENSSPSKMVDFGQKLVSYIDKELELLNL